MKTRKQIKDELLTLYRHFFDGNHHAPNGDDIRVAITKLENILKLDNQNR